jgi:hypothetical protein
MRLPRGVGARVDFSDFVDEADLVARLTLDAETVRRLTLNVAEGRAVWACMDRQVHVFRTPSGTAIAQVYGRNVRPLPEKTAELTLTARGVQELVLLISWLGSPVGDI